jgi:tRNA (guanine-N7-)-methyltransferase
MQDEKPEDKKPKTNEKDFLHRKDFQYTSNNPYHDRLKVFDEFVLRDDEGEALNGQWSKKTFNNEQEIAVEVGSGYGHFMMEYTQKYPEENFIGLDHRFKRSFQLARKLNSLEHKNFRYLRARGERLQFLFGDNEVSKLLYFFPDPWPKTRHHKKRLFQKPFLDACHKILRPGGKVFVKTDHDGYFEWMLEQMTKEDRFKVEIQTFDLRQDHPEHFLSSFVTKFEKIFLAKGIKIKALVLEKK